MTHTNKYIICNKCGKYANESEELNWIKIFNDMDDVCIKFYDKGDIRFGFLHFCSIDCLTEYFKAIKNIACKDTVIVEEPDYELQIHNIVDIAVESCKYGLKPSLMGCGRCGFLCLYDEGIECTLVKVKEAIGDW